MAVTRTRHAEEQRRYRARLREQAKPKADGTVAPRGAPETRAVVQALATSVRELARAVRADPQGLAAEAKAYQRLMRDAEKALKAGGFDGAESAARLIHYTLPDPAKARRRKAAAEERYWSIGRA